MHRDRRVTLDHEAIAALASLMGVNEPECRRIIRPRSVPQSSHATPATLIAGT
jgi:hypothetical protein